MTADGAAAVVLAGALALLAWSLTAAARRLDRLHRRVEGAEAALREALARRAGSAGALEGSGLLDAAAAHRLREAVAAVRDADGPAARERAESSLSRGLRAALDAGAVAALHRDRVGAALVADLADACERVVLARRFTNDAVVRAQRVRRKRLVRWARLAGRAPVPATVELDDEPPPALPARRVAGAAGAAGGPAGPGGAGPPGR